MYEKTNNADFAQYTDVAIAQQVVWNLVLISCQIVCNFLEFLKKNHWVYIIFRFGFSARERELLRKYLRDVLPPPPLIRWTWVTTWKVSDLCSSVPPPRLMEGKWRQRVSSQERMRCLPLRGLCRDCCRCRLKSTGVLVKNSFTKRENYNF